MREKRYIKLKDGQYVDSLHGEILTADEVLSRLQDEKSTSSSLIESEIEIIKRENNIKDKKNTHYFNWNNTKGNPTLFTKNYKVYQREVGKDMDIFEEGMMGILTRYLESETNRVLVDGKNPSNKQLEEMTGLGTRKVKEVLASLRKRKLIVTKGRGLGREIYVSPLWAFDGRHIDKQTLELFGLN